MSYPLYQYRYATTNKNISLYLLIAYLQTYTHTYLLTYLSPWNRVLLDKLTGSHLVKKFPTFCGTAFTSARHLSLLSILILSSHLRLGLPSGLSLFLRFPHHNSLNTSPLLHGGTCTAHLFLLDLITRTIFGVEYRSPNSSLRSVQSIHHILLRWLHISVV